MTTRFRSLELSSRYQPIFSLSSRRSVGYEGLLVACDSQGRSVPPNLLFEDTVATGEELYLDWLARALHLRSFSSLRSPGARLFVNLSPRVAIEDVRYPGVFKSVMDSCGIRPEEVVVEILEHAVADEQQLSDAVARYRELGCGLALDDFGTGASNDGRIERLRPDIVKLARPLVRTAGVDMWARRAFMELVARIQAGGAEVVVEGVENTCEARIAFDAGADYAQGFYFAMPSAGLPDPERVQSAFASLNPGAPRGRLPAPLPTRTSDKAC